MTSPVRRHSHRRQRDIGVVVKEFVEARMPLALGRDLFEHIPQQGQDGEDAIVRHGVWRMPAGIVAGIGQNGFDGEFTIPKPGVMGAAVADVIQRKQPGAQDVARDLKTRPDVPLDVFAAVPEHGEHLAEGHGFGGGPEREIGKFVVGLLEMADEDFAAALGAIMEVVEEASMLGGGNAGECGRVQMSNRAVAVDEFVNEAGAHGDFHTFDGIHDEEAELPVEGVTTPDRGRGRAGSKGVIGSLERIPIRAQPVVADGGELGDEFGFVSRETARQQQAGLLFVGERWLGVFHGRSPPRLENKKPTTVELGLHQRLGRYAGKRMPSAGFMSTAKVIQSDATTAYELFIELPYVDGHCLMRTWHGQVVGYNSRAAGK